MSNKIIIGVAIIVFAFVVVAFIARPMPGNKTNETGTLATIGALVATEESEFDFGSISMADGDVSHNFKIKNSGEEPLTIGKVYTSCMCTTATFIKDEKSFGPYGMIGHGFIPKINQKLLSGEEATIEVVFDPTTHGPAGIGKIRRAVTIENSGQSLELIFNAMVTP